MDRQAIRKQKKLNADVKAGPWTCYARPAPSGRTCGHQNKRGMRSQHGVCCESCGATKRAGDDRFARGDVDPGVINSEPGARKKSPPGTGSRRAHGASTVCSAVGAEPTTAASGSLTASATRESAASGGAT